MQPTMRLTRQWVLVCLGVALMAAPFAAWLSAVPAQEEQQEQPFSHARVVRLSFTEGTVTTQRPDLPDWSTAPVNTPIQEGFKLSTAENSFAEVEFENALSTARIGQLSLLEFNQLALAPDGGKVNRLTLNQGYATFHFVPSEQDVYEVKAGDATLTPNGKAEFRLDLDEGQARVEVFKGSVEVSSQEGSQTLTKNMALELRSGEPAEVAQGITKDDWDAWVAERDQTKVAVQAPASSGAYSAAAGSNLYGWSDLYSYGEWGVAPGYGTAWFPDVAFGWSPYSCGRWAWYGGFGYTWIPCETWGWLPFHYGSWFFDPVFGWGWMPGGFGYWSPGLVTWYQGPGWVGWAPQGFTHVRTAGGCPPGRSCATVVKTTTLQNGKPVSPQSLVAVDLGEVRSHRVSSPDLPPTQRAMLPGAPVPHAAAFLGASGLGKPGAAPRATQASAAGSQPVFVGKAPAPVRVREGERGAAGFSGRGAPPSGGAFGRESSGRSGQSHSAPRSDSGSSGGGRSSGPSGGGGFSGGGGGHVSGGAPSGGSIRGGGGGGGGGGHAGPHR